MGNAAVEEERDAAQPVDETPTRQVFIDANTPSDNLGDAVIVRQLLRMLRERADVVHVASAGMEPGLRSLIETGDEPVSIGAFLWHALKGRLSFHDRRSFTLVLKPGHIGGSYRGRAFTGRMGLLAVTALARALDVDVVRLGFSVGELSPGMLALERVQSCLMTTYSPRDRGSVTYARSQRMRVTGCSTDLAFSLPVAEPARRTTDVCLSFRSALVGPSGPGSYQDQVITLAHALLACAVRDGRTVCWAAQVSSDRPVAREALAAHAAIPVITFDGNQHSADGVLRAYAGSGVVVSNRLHAVLLAMSQGAPALAVTDLGAHSKLTDLLTGVGLGSVLVDLREGPEAIWTRVLALLDDPDAARRDIHRVFAEQSTILRQSLNGLAW